MKASILFVVVVLLFQIQAVDVNITTCINHFITLVKWTGLNCDKYRSYVKLFLKEKRFFDPSVATDENLRSFKKELHSLLEAHEHICDLDLKNIVTEIQNELNQGGNPVTESPTDYQDARTTDGCKSVLIHLGAITCCEFIPYLRCVMQVMGLDKIYRYFPENSYKQIQDDINDIVSCYGLKCEQGVRSMVDNIRKG